ncbi:MAG: D-alanyl-D-alanine carboxypeptidase family protein [Paenisporosarcina sp.]
MQSHKFTNKNNNKTRSFVLWTSFGLVLLLVPLIWLGLHDWSMGESLEEVGYVKKVIDGTPEETPVPEKNTPPIQPDTQPEKDTKNGENPSEEQPNSPPTEKPIEKVEEPVSPVENPPASEYEPNKELPSTPTYIQGILVANKHFPLPSTYAPGESKEAREAFNKLASAARLEGFELVAFSTYRSYDYQKTLYEKYVEKDGQEAADRYSARPGYSEHQSGLAFDIGEKNFEQHFASSTFGSTPAGMWIADHAHEYGFILRYPLGKEKITGYMHESWHFRFVGVGPAQDMYSNNKTLEEYLEL